MLGMALIIAFSCTPNSGESNIQEDSLKILSPTNDRIIFNAEGGEEVISFTSSNTWEIAAINDRADDWCSISPNKGDGGEHNVIIKVSSNNTHDERNATIKLKSGAKEEILYVSQKQKDALTISSSSYTVLSSGGTIDITIKTNISYSYQICNEAETWIRPLSTKALETSTLTFSIDENTELTNREGEIIITGGEFSETIKIYQESATPSIIVSEQNIAVGAQGETIAIEVKGNVNATPHIPSEIDWISEVSTKAWSTNTYYFLINPNESYESRTATIAFVNEDNGLNESVVITQMQKNAIVIATNSYSFNNNGGTFSVEINSNVDFDINIENDWVKQVETKGLSTTNIHFAVAENESYDNRETIISFISKDKDISQEIRVYQSQTNAIIISEKEKTISPSGETFDVEIRANVSFDVIMPDVDWVQKIETKALTPNTLHLCVKTNDSYDNRSCTIIIRDSDTNVEDRLSILQLQKDAIVIAQNEYNFTSEGGTLQIDVAHNVEYNIEISSDWIACADTKGLNNTSHNFVISKNSTYDNREGKITFKSGAISQEILIKQNATLYFETTAESEYLFKCEGGELAFDVNSSLPVEISISENANSWIKPISTKAISTSSYTFNISPYDGHEERSGTISVSSCDTTLVISIRQGDNLQMPNEIWYTSTDGQIVEPYNESWGDIHIEQNTYDAITNKGIITFSGPITIIEDEAFYSCTTLKSIELPSKLTAIGNKAFNYCTSLETVNFRQTTTIGEQAFAYCSSLNNIIISRVTSMGKQAFAYCTSLESVSIDGDISTLNTQLFYECTSLSKVTLPDCIETIKDNVFSRCSNLSEFKMPKSTHTLGYGVFSATGLTSYTLPASITKVDATIFGSCVNLTSLDIQSNITSIPGSFCSGCTSLTQVSLPNTITSIGKWAFYKCSALENIIIPNSVVTIGESAFNGCSGAKKVHIPNSVKTLEVDSFNGCGGELFIDTDTESYYSPAYGPFNKHAFTTIEFGENVTKIGSSIFEYNGGDRTLKTVKMSNSVKEIGSSTFKWTGVEEVIFSNTLETIGSYAFTLNPITSLSLPSTLKSIGAEAFANCTELTSITIPDSVESFGENAFYGCSSLTNADYPENDIFTTVGNQYSYCISIKEITIPNTITKIDGAYKSDRYRGAFEGCTSLEKIELPNSIEYIGSYTFLGCESLKEVTIPNNPNLTELYEGIFHKCHSLEKVTLPDNITSIRFLTKNGGTNMYPFYECYNLKHISLPKNMTEINGSIFYACYGLESITLGKKIQSIKGNAFSWCYNLKEITLPVSLKEIGTKAFYQCQKLESIYCNAIEPPTLDNTAFDYVTSSSLPSGSPAECTIYVPQNSLDAYIEKWTWKGKTKTYKIVGQ